MSGNRRTYKGLGYVPNSDSNPLANGDELVVLQKSDCVLFAQGDRYVEIAWKDALDLADALGRPIPKQLAEIRDELAALRQAILRTMGAP